MTSDVQFFLGVLALAVIALGVAVLTLRPTKRERRLRDLYDDGDVTPIERPILNPANAPFVKALLGASAGIEASALRLSGGLRDIARTLRLASDVPDSKIKIRVADTVQEFASDVGREAVALREV